MTQRVSNQTLRYNAKDCIVTYECADAFHKEVDRPSYKEMPSFRQTYDHTIDLLEPLMYMMSRGVKVDRNKLAEERINISKRIDELQSEINEICGADINPNSPKQLMEYFYVTKGITPYTKLNAQKKSVITVDDRALQRLARGTASRRGLKEAGLIQEYRKLNKLRGTYLDIAFDSDNRLRCSYNPRGTRFARLSSSKTVFGTGMNMQNLPATFLSFLIADEDCIFLQLDKSHAEWVVVAYNYGEENMISAIEQGIDPHAYTASKMFKVPLELIIEENKALGHTSDPDEVREYRMGHPELSKLIEENRWLPRTMSMRQCGKKSNHGLNYDESPNMFGLINEITQKEAAVIVEFYHRLYPGIRRGYEHTKQQLQTNGRVLTNLFGRPYRFLGAWNADLFKAAYSYVPQSTVGELVNRAIVNIYHASLPEFSNLEILQQVHDSVTLQIPLSDPNLGHAIHTAARLLSPKLSAHGREFVIRTDLRVGKNLRDMTELRIDSNPNKLAESVRRAVGGEA